MRQLRMRNNNNYDHGCLRDDRPVDSLALDSSQSRRTVLLNTFTENYLCGLFNIVCRMKQVRIKP